MNYADKPRFKDAPLTYAFLHLKGMKEDRGTRNWGVGSTDTHLRAAWVNNVLSPNPDHLASIEAMRRHNPAYFRGADVFRELQVAFPDLPVRPATVEQLPALGVREHLADIWYRIAYP